nr:hypothetical protein [Ornithinibacillus caprae]
MALTDWKNIKRDPLLIFSMLGPLLLAVLARIGLPELDRLLNQYMSFNFQAHFLIIISLVLLMTPLMIGMLFGFIILDERDEGILLYYSITPLTKVGYLYGRLLVPMGLTFILSFMIVLIQGVVQIDVFSFVPVAILLALQTPIITMIMSTLASNKVEGLALTKVINLCILVPLIDYVFTNPMVKLVMLFPVYWPVSMLINMNSSYYWYQFLIGVMVTFLWFILLKNKFQKKIE